MSAREFPRVLNNGKGGRAIYIRPPRPPCFIETPGYAELLHMMHAA